MPYETSRGSASPSHFASKRVTLEQTKLGKFVGAKIKSLPLKRSEKVLFSSMWALFAVGWYLISEISSNWSSVISPVVGILGGLATTFVIFLLFRYPIVFLSIVTTFFLFSMVRMAILIPQIFKESSAILFDHEHQYGSSENRQMALFFSDVGLLNPFIWGIVLYIFYGLILFSTKSTNNSDHPFRRIWINMLNISTIMFGLLVTAFSVWKA